LFVSVQQPEDFNFDITRAINTHVHQHAEKPTNQDAPNSSTEKVPDEKAGEKAETQSVAESSVQIGITRAEDLDPVALDKAFKFAAWSSVALVRFFIKLLLLFIY
jgi:hypothetical protein